MNNKRKPMSAAKLRGLIILGAAILLVLVVVIVLLSLRGGKPVPPAADTTISPVPSATANQPVVEEVAFVDINLGHGLYITDVGKYTGSYVEDGSNELVSGVLMIVVKNTGEEDIQYGEITMIAGQEDAKFSFSTLPAGESVVLLEQEQKNWVAGTEYAYAIMQNVVVFPEPISLQEDKLKIQNLDGILNVTNCSGADISGNIVIYYKNSATDLLYGGITYRVRIEGGLADGELRQIVANHFSSSGSRIMFVTIE